MCFVLFVGFLTRARPSAIGNAVEYILVAIISRYISRARPDPPQQVIGPRRPHRKYRRIDRPTDRPAEPRPPLLRL